MRSIHARTVGLLAALALLGAVPAAVEADAASSRPQAVVAKSCSSGYVHAVLPSGHKCLRRGQFCSRKSSFQRVYHRKGFHCKANRHLGYY
jgi:hypothetical protein